MVSAWNLPWEGAGAKHSFETVPEMEAFGGLMTGYAVEGLSPPLPLSGRG